MTTPDLMINVRPLHAGQLTTFVADSFGVFMRFVEASTRRFKIYKSFEANKLFARRHGRHSRVLHEDAELWSMHTLVPT